MRERLMSRTAADRRRTTWGRASSRVLVGVFAAALLATTLLCAFGANGSATPAARVVAVPQVDLATPVLTAGDHATFAVYLRSAGAWTLTFTTGKTRQGPFTVIVGSRGHVEWTWKVPSNARAATWHGTVAYAGTGSALQPKSARHLSLVFKVARSKHFAAAKRTLRIVAGGSIRATLRSNPPDTGVPASVPVSQGQGAGLLQSPNGFDIDQCTGYADSRRPDIYRTAVAHGVQRSGWNGNMWGVFAARGGIATGTLPVKGAIASFQGGQYGHVAYVESVNSDGSYVVSEDNAGPSEVRIVNGVPVEEAGYPDGPDPSVRTIYTTPAGTVFIYGGPAGIGPTSPAAGQSFGSTPTVASWGVGRLDAFARGPAGDLIHGWYDGAWHPWESLSANGLIQGAPTAVCWGPGRIDVFALGTDNHLVTWVYDAAGWHGPAEPAAGQSFGSTPTVASWGVGRLDAFARGPAGDLIHGWYDGAWHPWESLSANGLIQGAPTAVCWGPGRIDVFALGTNNHLLQWWYDVAGWHGPAEPAG